MDITRKFNERVAATLQKVDPQCTKACELLGDIDRFEIESFDLEVSASAPAPQAHKTSYLDAPLLTLRELMPGSTGHGDDDGDLDQAFRGDKVKFLVMQRKLTPNEIKTDGVLEDVADVDWGIHP